MIRKQIQNIVEYILPLKGDKNFVLLLFISIIFQFLLFATPILAQEAVQEEINLDIKNSDIVINKSQEQRNYLPKNDYKKFEVVNSFKTQVTAYNVGSHGQTDNTPCISANGENICKALDRGYKRCATNFVPLGTMIEIENYGKCLVTDRMNKRYTYRVDIAMKKTEKSKARNFGLKNLKVKTLTR